MAFGIDPDVAVAIVTMPILVAPADPVREFADGNGYTHYPIFAFTFD